MGKQVNWGKKLGSQSSVPQRVAHTGLVEFLQWRVVALVLGGVLCTVLSWVAVEYVGYRYDAETRRQRLVGAKMAEVRAHVKDALNFIAFARGSDDSRLRGRLKSRTDEAWNLVQHLNRQRGSESSADTRHLILDALRNVRWNNGSTCYFIVDLQGKIQLNPRRPELEGRNITDVEQGLGKEVFREFSRHTQCARWIL